MLTSKPLPSYGLVDESMPRTHVLSPPPPPPTPMLFSPTRTLLAAVLVVVCVLFALSGGVLPPVVPLIDLHAVLVDNLLTQLEQSHGIVATLRLKRASLHTSSGTSIATIYLQPQRGGASTDRLAMDAAVLVGGANSSQVYSLVHNRAYASIVGHDGVVLDVQCMDPSHVPPLSLVPASLLAARPVDAVHVNDKPAALPHHCHGTQLLHLTFAGEAFVLCVSLTSHHVTHVFGQDIELDMTYLPTAAALEEMALPRWLLDVPRHPHTNETLACRDLPPVDASLSSQTDGHRGLRESTIGQDEPTTAHRIATIGQSHCGCKLPEKKPCLFVHGMGELFAHDLSETFPRYWGDVHRHAPCCSSVRFTHFDTINRGWTNPALQQEFCDAAVAVGDRTDDDRQNDTTTTVGKLLLVVHSMGNLVAGAALASKRCRFSRDVTYVQLGGPMKGSMAANLFQSMCVNHGWNAAVEYPLTFFGICPPPQGPLSLLYESTLSDDDAEIGAYEVAQRTIAPYVTKAACGTSGVGLLSLDSVVFDLVGHLANHPGLNDGVVDFGSCAAGLDPASFGRTYTHDLYKPAVNHADLTFRNKDGWWGDYRKPLKWFECGL
ncbi:Aste57867_17684 [Aphanomyces stellatus]|uniref:Aste57867_17684 protein n=1 Tax=Aphanomyces stellatus TaxID=120398 RepID=A0A485L8B1_9STRA|nr:hypothetical protein As57867_017623 [Aphanomyces stellatus]VFT94434.1 Aste57867_17684 [Aphanomyces stellatus]